MKKLFLSLLVITYFSIIASSQILIDDGPININEHIIAPEYVIQGNYWDHQILTYWFSNGTNDIAGNDEQGGIRLALSLWEEQTDLIFLEVCDSLSADIIFRWGTGDHGCGYPFDGIYGTLAHAFYPPPNGYFAGDIHFDDDENWTMNLRSSSNQPIDLVSIAAHEIGHALGLDHSSEPDALMYAFYSKSHRYLHQDDINGIRSIYGNPGTYNFYSNVTTFICASGATFEIVNPPAVDSIIWEYGPYLTISSGQYTDVCTIASTGSGSSWVRVRLVNDCGSITLPQKTVWSGVPSTSQFDIRNVDFYGFNYLYEDMTNQLIANDYTYQPAITEWEWDYGGWYHWEVTSTKYISFVDVPSFSYRDISVRAKNQCPGASSWYTERFYPYEGFFLIFSPNPSTGETVLSIESASTEKTFDETTEWELEVYSETQLLKERKTRLKGKNTTIQTYGWQDGIYLVRVKYKEELLTGKLMVKKR